MTRCGAGGKKRELRNIVRSSRFFLQPCCRSGWSRPTSGAQCSSGDCLLLCSGTCSLLCYRPATGPPRSIPGAGRSLPGRYSFEALSLSAGPVLLRTFSRGGVLPSRPALLRGPFVAVRCPFLLLPGALPFRPAGAPSGLPVPLRDFRRYRAAANSLSRAISSGQRSSSGVSRMSGMPSKRASEAM